MTPAVEAARAAYAAENRNLAADMAEAERLAGRHPRIASREFPTG